MPKKDERVTKRRVTMTNYGVAGVDSAGKPVVSKIEKVDYVRPDFLDAYVENARAAWGSVVVSDEPDAGPGGYDGETHIPAELDHPDAGKTFPATSKES
jgi:hypothetical protein